MPAPRNRSTSAKAASQTKLPPGAFVDPQAPPGESSWTSVLGRSGRILVKMLAEFAAIHPEATAEWKYTAGAGWYRICLLKKRRLFYLRPMTGDFRFSMVLGDRAIALLVGGPCAARVKRLVKSARRFPEGTVFSFDRESFKPDLALALLEAKIAH